MICLGCRQVCCAQECEFTALGKCIRKCRAHLDSDFVARNGNAVGMLVMQTYTCISVLDIKINVHACERNRKYHGEPIALSGIALGNQI